MSLTEEKFREILYSIIEKKVPCISDVKIRPINSLNGFTSSLYEATIVTPDDNVEVFAKVTAMGGMELGDCLFNTETFFYTVLAKTYEEIQDKHGLAKKRFIFPKYYGSSSKNGVQVVVMENLVAKGYECRHRLDCIDWKYASKCVETLAKHHALSLALCKKYPEEFNKAGEVLKIPDISNPEWNGLTKGALTVLDEADQEKLSELLEGSEGWGKVVEMCNPRKTSVIIHGDYRSGNLMHRDVDGELHVIPVDYQTARLGCPVADLIYFIVTGSDQQFRQQHFHELIDYYYKQLALAMTKIGLVPEEVYGREEFEGDLKAKLPLGICAAAVVLPFVTVDSSDAPSFGEGDLVPRSSELFAQRFLALFQDFKQWGYI